MNRNQLAIIGYKFKEVYGVEQTVCPDLFGAFVAGYMQREMDARKDEPVGVLLSGDELRKRMAEAGIAEYKNE